MHSTEGNTSDSSSTRSIWCVSACTKPDASDGQNAPAAVAALLPAHSGKNRLKFRRVRFVNNNYTRDRFLICKIKLSIAFKTRLPISCAKKADLLAICKSRVVPKEHHEFFKRLPSSKDADWFDDGSSVCNSYMNSYLFYLHLHAVVLISFCAFYNAF